jgi:hypothetical protein
VYDITNQSEAGRAWETVESGYPFIELNDKHFVVGGCKWQQVLCQIAARFFLFADFERL